MQNHQQVLGQILTNRPQENPGVPTHWPFFLIQKHEEKVLEGHFFHKMRQIKSGFYPVSVHQS